MQKPNEHYRVLVFNQCEARLHHLAHTGHSLDIVAPQHDPQRRWRGGLWPLPDAAVEADRPTAAARAREGAYDFALCQTIADLAVAREWGLPRLFAPLGLMGGGVAAEPLYAALDGALVAFASQEQQQSWGVEGAVIAPCVDPGHWGLGTGSVAEVLYYRLGAAERIQHAALSGLPNAGADPRDAGAAALLQSHRVLFSAAAEGRGDGGDECVLAAMAAGVPVVTAATDSQLIADGRDGFAGGDFRQLRERLRELLQAPAAAAEFGRNARRTVEERYNVRDRIADWSALFAECAGGSGVDLPPPSVAPRVSIALAVRDRAEATEASLMALAQNTADEPAYEVFVVDNASRDWTQYLLHAFEGDLRVQYNDEDQGLARAYNQAAALAQGEYLLFLGQGAAPQEGWLEEMVRLAASDPAIGIVGARLQHPTAGQVQWAALESVDGAPKPVRRVADDGPAAGDCEVVDGACMLVRRALFAELDGFDDGGFAGAEDADLCLRARERGWRVVHCPASVVAWDGDGGRDAAGEGVRRFGERWQGRFGGAEAVAKTRWRGHWEGPFLVYSSLAAVNRELVAALLADGRCDLGLLQSEPDQLPADAAGPRLGAVVERLGKRLDGEPDFHLRHHWPPDFSRPASGKLVVMQPWEFGRIPREWVDPIRANVDQIWAYTSYVRDCYIASGIDPGLVEVVRLGVDTERFKPGLPRLDLPTEKTFKLLYVGGTVHRKGIDHLLEAYRRAFAPEDDVCLVIKDIGTRTFYQNQHAGDAIRALQNDPACPEILYLTEDLPDADVPHLYAACDALVHPYRGEGFGLPVAEAMACGLPVVVTAGGACDDFCDDETAYMVPAERVPVQFPDGTEFAGQAWLLEPDTEALVAQMRRVRRERDGARERGRRAAARIAGEFTWRHAARDALAALDKLLPDKGDSPPIAPSATVHVQPPPPTVPVAPVVAVPARSAAGATLVTLGSVAAGAVTAASEGLGGAALVLAAGREDDSADWGARLEDLRGEAQGDFLVFIGEGVEPNAADVRLLVECLQQRQDAGLAVPGVGTAGDAGVDIAAEGLFAFRRQALEAIGGFDRSFRSAAALSEAGRQLDRQGWPVVRVPGCAAGAYRPLGGDYEGELAAVRHLAAGDQWRGLADDEAALEAYRLAVEAKGDFVEPIVVLSALLMELGRAAEAADYLERLVALEEASFQAHNYLGLARYQAGQVEAARAHMLRALALNPSYVETLVNLAVLEWEQDRPAEAIDYLERAAELEPGNRDVIVNTAIMHSQSGNAGAGVALLREYLELNPRDGDAASSLADILIQCGELAAARELALGLLALDPQYPAAQAILERIRGQEEQGQA